MHHVGVPLHGAELLHLHRAEFADLPQVVAAQVHQHIVLRQLLFVGEKVRLQGFVLRIRPPSGPGARQGEGVENAVLQLHQGLRRGPRHLHVGTGEVEHIRGGVQGPQDAVGVQQAPLEGGGEPVGQDDLEDVPLPDVVLALFHHGTVGGLVEEGGDLPQQPSAGLVLLFAVLQQVRQVLQVPDRPVVARLGLGQVHVDHQDDLLPEVVEGDDLVEEHQVYVLEPLGVHGFPFCRGLPVGQVVVGEIPHQATGEGGQVVKPGTFIVRQDLPQVGRGVVGAEGQAPHLHLPVQAGDLQLGVEAQEGVPPPLLPAVYGFQDVAVGGYVFQLFQGLDGGAQVGEQLAAHGQDLVGPGLRDGPDLLQAGFYVHIGSFPCRRQQKTPSTESCSVKDE